MMAIQLNYAINTYVATIAEYGKFIDYFKTYIANEAIGSFIELNKTSSVFEILGERIEFTITPHKDSVNGLIGYVVCKRIFKTVEYRTDTKELFSFYFDKYGEFGLELNDRGSFDLVGKLINLSSVDTFLIKPLLRSFLNDFGIDTRAD
ncbi:hypothetical protein L9G16_09840 [Shewanella sp. A25]|nr:hypothetical protein [Shewanella shenzhenensis]